MDSIEPEKLAEFKDAFALIDKNNDGAISAKELKEVMVAVGEHTTDEEVQAMIDHADLDTNGRVDFPEFAKMMKKRMEQNQLLEAFQTFDKDGSGKVSGKELKDVMKNVGEEMSEEQLTAMINEADKDGDGHVNYQEFLKVMANK